MVLSILAFLVLASGIGGLAFLVHQWREEARDGLDGLRVSLMLNDERTRGMGDAGANAARDASAVARNVVDLIKIELPPLLAAAPRALPAEPAGDLVVRRTVPFVRTGAEGGAEIRRMIGEIRGELQKLTAGRACAIAVDGHTDTRGSDTANLELSEKRATFVAEALRSEFGGATTIATVGWGERRLKVMTPDGTDEVENRRVEVTLTCPPPATRAAAALTSR